MPTKPTKRAPAKAPARKATTKPKSPPPFEPEPDEVEVLAEAEILKGEEPAPLPAPDRPEVLRPGIPV